VAIGLQSGQTVIVNSATGKTSVNLNENWQNEQPFFMSKSPITSLNSVNKDSKCLMISASSSGIVKGFIFDDSSMLSNMQFKFDDKRQTLCSDISQEGTQICTGGSGGYLRVYDLASEKLMQTLGPEGEMKSRIFCAKYEPQSMGNVIYSGGWDNVINIWDTRIGINSVKYIYDPHVCGDTISFFKNDPNRLLIGSWRRRESIQIYNIKSRAWENSEQERCENSLLYVLKSIDNNEISDRSLKDSQLCLAGGCNKNNLRLINLSDGFEILDSFDAGKNTVTCLTKSGNSVFAGCSNSLIKFDLSV